MATSSFSSMVKSGQHAYRCSVCLDKYDHPKVISCGHTFCKDCLQQLPTRYRSRLKKTFQCPECRYEVTFPSSGRVEDFPTNFAIMGAIELSVDGHMLQSLCVKHKKNRDLFCNSCRLCICVDCFAQKHKLETHDVTSTTDRANETVEQLRSAEECYKQSQCTRLFNRISEMEDNNVENARAVVRRINEVKETMIEEIERQAGQIVKVVEVVTEDKKQEFGRIKQSIKENNCENLEKAKQCSLLVDEISKFGLSQERFDKGRDLCAIQENDVPPSDDDEGEYDDKDAIDEFVSSSFHQLDHFNNTLEFQENPENNCIVFGFVKQSESKLLK